MKVAILASALALGSAGCSHLPHTHGNNRPGLPGPNAQELVDKCVFAVRFNEDEATVREGDYMDAMYCMGLMDGISGGNEIVQREHPEAASFCLPEGGIKTWLLAKAAVDYAKARPDLLALPQLEFATMALASSYPCAK